MHPVGEMKACLDPAEAMTPKWELCIFKKKKKTEKRKQKEKHTQGISVITVGW